VKKRNNDANETRTRIIDVVNNSSMRNFAAAKKSWPASDGKTRTSGGRIKGMATTANKVKTATPNSPGIISKMVKGPGRVLNLIGANQLEIEWTERGTTRHRKLKFQTRCVGMAGCHSELRHSNIWPTKPPFLNKKRKWYKCAE
jgi:hypothetical protein